MLDPQLEPLILDRFTTPVGELILVTDGRERLRALDFADCEARMLRLLARHAPGHASRPGRAPAAIRAAIDAYFAGTFDALAAIPCATGGTAFQRSVWGALTQIPAGTTLTYAQLATQIGRPSAMRAVGLANGANPIGIVVPCHRVIGSSGKLTGYAGGLARKQWLLAHEGVRACA